MSAKRRAARPATMAATPATRTAPRRPTTAAEILAQKLKQQPDDHATRLKLAQLLMTMGDLDAAQAHLKFLSKVSTHRAQALILLSHLHRSVNRVVEALRAAKEAVKLAPGDYDARKQLGLAYLAARESSAGIEQLARAVKLGPRRPELHRLLGEAYLKRYKKRLAVKSLREAVRLAPKDPWPRMLLGDAFRAMGLHRQATEAYKRAAALTGGAPVFRAQALDKLGTLYYQRGFKGRARRVLKACRKMFPHLGCPYTDVALLPANPIRIPGTKLPPMRRYPNP